ncbi:phosphatase PAP2 family protein [Lagierella sp.]|uniref:phosphatase PAP2 family protein n=1 Tax=Lagierella sp. TaxID=2849657 RepID=UPI0026048B6D|nr:phosphatase PAP2 family protein [Lagierella sp.]
MLKRDKIIICLTIIWVLFLGISLKLGFSPLKTLDNRVLNLFVTYNKPINFYKFVTIFGNTNTYFYIFIPVGLWMIFHNSKRGFGYILVSILLSTILVIALKNIVQRTRPIKYFIIDQDGYSFPSGHALVSSATYWTIYRNTKVKNKFFKTFLIIFPILIGLSRLALGVHWPTDVFTGLLIGYCVALINGYLYLKKGSTNEKKFA